MDGVLVPPETRDFSDQLILEVRKWASLRGQTLYRTVRGIMDVSRGMELVGMMEAETCDDAEKRKLLADLVPLKHAYVVSCQVSDGSEGHAAI